MARIADIAENAPVSMGPGCLSASEEGGLCWGRAPWRVIEKSSGAPAATSRCFKTLGRRTTLTELLERDEKAPSQPPNGAADRPGRLQ